MVQHFKFFKKNIRYIRVNLETGLTPEQSMMFRRVINDTYPTVDSLLRHSDEN